MGGKGDQEGREGKRDRIRIEEAGRRGKSGRENGKTGREGRRERIEME